MTNDQDTANRFMWQVATVTKIYQETDRVKTFTLSLSVWQEHLPGQHYDIRLTASDGYQAQRSYSVASSGVRSGEIDLTIDLIENGEISSYLHHSIAVGDQVEVRGPIGGYFVWAPGIQELPLLLIAGGSGIVPLMSMLRHRKEIKVRNQTALLLSVRSQLEFIYRTEIESMANSEKELLVNVTYTRNAPESWSGDRRRIDTAMLMRILSNFSDLPQCFVCGPSGFVEQIAADLLRCGIPETLIRTERFN